MLKMTHLANIVTRPRPVKELSAVFDIVAWLTCFLRDCNMAQSVSVQIVLQHVLRL